MDFAIPAEQRIKLKECEKMDKYLDLIMEHEVDDYTNRDWCFPYSN